MKAKVTCFLSNIMMSSRETVPDSQSVLVSHKKDLHTELHSTLWY